MGDGGKINIFDDMPTDERGQKQYVAAMYFYKNLVAVAEVHGSGHAVNGIFGGLINFLLHMERQAGHECPEMRKEIIDCLQRTAKHIEQLDTTLGAKGLKQ